MAVTPIPLRTRTRSYRILGWATAVLFFYLFVSALFFSRSFIADLGIGLSESVFFLCRRASLFLLGIAVLAFCARNTTHSSARQAILLSIGSSMLGMAGLGLVEFLRGFVNTAIFFPITVESLVACLHLFLWFCGWKADRAAALAPGEN